MTVHDKFVMVQSGSLNQNPGGNEDQVQNGAIKHAIS